VESPSGNLRAVVKKTKKKEEEKYYIEVISYKSQIHDIYIVDGLIS